VTLTLSVLDVTSVELFQHARRHPSVSPVECFVYLTGRLIALTILLSQAICPTVAGDQPTMQNRNSIAELILTLKQEYESFDDRTRIAKLKQYSLRTLEGAIHFGMLLMTSTLKAKDYKTQTGYQRRDCEQLIILVSHPRLLRDDWTPPKKLDHLRRIARSNGNR
jgi:hypothetical protein